MPLFKKNRLEILKDCVFRRILSSNFYLVYKATAITSSLKVLCSNSVHKSCRERVQNIILSKADTSVFRSNSVRGGKARPVAFIAICEIIFMKEI